MNKQKINVTCAGCDVFLRKRKGKKKMIKNITEANHFSLALKRKIDVDDILCSSCRLSAYKKNLNNERQGESPESSTPNGKIQGDSPKSINPNGERLGDSPE